MDRIGSTGYTVQLGSWWRAAFTRVLARLCNVRN
jgi:hypothetical protein